MDSCKVIEKNDGEIFNLDEELDNLIETHCTEPNAKKVFLIPQNNLFEILEDTKRTNEKIEQIEQYADFSKYSCLLGEE